MVSLLFLFKTLSLNSRSTTCCVLLQDYITVARAHDSTIPLVVAKYSFENRIRRNELKDWCEIPDVPGFFFDVLQRQQL